MYYTSVSVVLFFIPLGIMVTVYGAIIYKLRTAKRLGETLNQNRHQQDRQTRNKRKVGQ